MNPKTRYNQLLAQKTIEELAKRNIDGFYCETKQDALQKLIELVPEGSTVSCGGSATLHELGARAALKQGGRHFLDPDDAQGAAAKDAVAHEALGVDYYLMSANAIAATGELVNIDGYGNRVAALIFGPRHVVIIAGMNKVTPGLEAAVRRAREFAAPMILLKFRQDYAAYAELMQAAQGACGQFVITERSTAKGRIVVLLVGEDLGY